MKILIWFYLLYLFVIAGINRSFPFLSKEIEGLFRLIPLMLFVFSLNKKKVKGIFKQYYMIIIILIYSIINIIVSIINGNSLFVIFLHYIDIFVFFFILISFITLDDNIFYSKLEKFFLFFAFIQPLICLYQFIVSGQIGDHVAGTFGEFATNSLMLYQLSIFIYFIEKKKVFNKFNIKNILYLIWLFVPAILGSSIAGFVLFPVVILLYLILSNKSIKKIINLSIMGSIIILVIQFLSQYFFDEFRLGLFDVSNAYSYSTGIGESGYNRLDAIIYSVLYIIEKGEFILGYGIGSTFGGQGKNVGILFAQFGKLFGRSSFQMILLNLGIVGILLYLSFSWQIIKNVFKSLNRINYSNYLVIITIVMTLFSGYSANWFQDVISLHFALILSSYINYSYKDSFE